MWARQPEKRWNASKGFYKILSEIPKKMLVSLANSIDFHPSFGGNRFFLNVFVKNLLLNLSNKKIEKSVVIFVLETHIYLKWIAHRLLAFANLYPQRLVAAVALACLLMARLLMARLLMARLQPYIGV